MKVEYAQTTIANFLEANIQLYHLRRSFTAP